MPELVYLYAAGAFVAGFIIAAVVFRARKAPAAEALPEPQPAKPALEAAKPAPGAEKPEVTHASGLFLLGMLQREGRLIDFLQEDIAGYSDEQVGAASRVVHDGCRKVVKQYLSIEPVLAQAEGDTVNVPAGFDAARIRLTGNVAGNPPFKGALKHHGWAAKDVKLPVPSHAIDPKILAPAEVELP